MPAPGEHKTVQARILAYAQEIGWGYVSRADAEARRGFDPDGATPRRSAPCPNKNAQNESPEQWPIEIVT